MRTQSTIFSLHKPSYHTVPQTGITLPLFPFQSWLDSPLYPCNPYRFPAYLFSHFEERIGKKKTPGKQRRNRQSNFKEPVSIILTRSTYKHNNACFSSSLYLPSRYTQNSHVSFWREVQDHFEILGNSKGLNRTHLEKTRPKINDHSLKPSHSYFLRSHTY